MTPLAASFIVASVVATSFISGVFGMAGGMILMGLLLYVLPVSSAMVLHGVTQMASNGWRGVVWRRYVAINVSLRYMLGLLLASGLFFFISYVPAKAVVLMFLGALPFIVLSVPIHWIPQVDRPWGAELCGFLNATLQFLAGISGPVLDAFFIRTSFDRRTVIATKAVCQTTAHLAKLVYFSHMATTTSDASRLSLWLMLGCVAMAMVGTMLSRKVLEGLSDHQFRFWTKRLLLGIGVVYFIQGLVLYFD